MNGDCGDCTHSAAYHDGDGGRICRAWAPNDEATTDVCPCKGWVEPKSVPLPVAAPSVDADDFGWVG